ncbi:hypothetical protein BBD41_01425 [Paenibacillus ihbetae]|uniref:Uncharacterized protein n=1 Tax=Paenibacillus ihbetae TaxID=1870820 RepID=A0A1B2DUG7_9BACL|nr:hypothetical protein [Paenibacillus ihbetae]ANY71349.1 hypothetical protein BBD41_01425 [Paenibacillus ihbetae]OOC61291.1 hypothetical protein BBD40_04925 [Paenibacillus ihbetae]
MAKYKALMTKDLQHALKDPVLMADMIGPLVLIFLSRFGFPIAVHWLDMNYSFNLEQYRGFVASLLAVTIPMLTGMLTGLLMLDERDENMIAYYAVTPLMHKGYLLYRLALPTLLCIVLSAIYLQWSTMTEFRWETLYALLLLALESPMFSLFLAAFSSNKVEGLALSKIGGLFIIGPVVVHFVPGAWQALGALFPSYWPAKVLDLTMHNEPLPVFVYFLMGLVLHLACLYFMVTVFKNKQE